MACPQTMLWSTDRRHFVVKSAARQSAVVANIRKCGAEYTANFWSPLNESFRLPPGRSLEGCFRKPRRLHHIPDIACDAAEAGKLLAVVAVPRSAHRPVD